MQPTHLVRLLRSLDTATRSMTLPYHAQVLARHYVEHPQRLSDVVAISQHLVSEISTPEQAQQALEWIALRLPVEGAMAQQRDCPDLALEAGVAIQDMVATLAVRADLSARVQDQEVSSGLDNPTESLGSVLLALGHSVDLGLHIPDPKEIPMLARTAVDHGKYGRAAELLAMVDPTGKDDLIETIWQAVARTRDDLPATDLDALPDPPVQWWAEVQSNRFTVSGNKVAQRILLDRPHLLTDYISGVLQQGEAHLVHPTMLQQAWKAQDQWPSGEGWSGSPLEALMARAGDDEEPWKNRLLALTSGAAALATGAPDGALPNDYLVRLLATASDSDRDFVAPKEFVEARGRLTQQKNKECIGEVISHWDKYPRGKYGAMSAGLCELAGRGMARWAGKNGAAAPFLTLVRSAYTHENFVQALERGDHDTVESHARSAQLLLAQAPRLDARPEATMTPAQKDDQLELLLWHFVSERLGRRAKDHRKKGNLDALSPRQNSTVRNIAAFMEAGAKPNWPDRVGVVAMQLLAMPSVDLPGGELASLQRVSLETTASTQNSRRGPRL